VLGRLGFDGDSLHAAELRETAEVDHCPRIRLTSFESRHEVVAARERDGVVGFERVECGVEALGLLVVELGREHQSAPPSVPAVSSTAVSSSSTSTVPVPPSVSMGSSLAAASSTASTTLS